MTPAWLGLLAWITIAAGCATAAAILFDIYGSGRRQHVRVMEAVWPITALYLGPFGWPVYAQLGRPRRPPYRPAGAPADRMAMVHEEELPGWRGYVVSATHCGAGCALGDGIGEWIVFAFALGIAGNSLWAEYIVDFALGYVFGIFFQYAAIRPMRRLTRRDALLRAIQADTLSIIAFEAGMFAWMALFQRVLFPALRPDDAAYWLMMQIAMAIGLLAAFPVQIWLIGRGIKEPMGRPVIPLTDAAVMPR